MGEGDATNLVKARRGIRELKRIRFYNEELGRKLKAARVMAVALHRWLDMLSTQEMINLTNSALNYVNFVEKNLDEKINKEEEKVKDV